MLIRLFWYSTQAQRYYAPYFREACRVSKTCGRVSIVPSARLAGRRKLASNSILASAMSCSLPLPLATFCASAI